MGLCSPPAWGWSALLVGNGVRNKVLPTRVGMVRIPSRESRGSLGAPHPRGDGPQGQGRGRTGAGCSPPAWGWSDAAAAAAAAMAVLPTRVGMVRSQGTQSKGLGRAPHPRGDGPQFRKVGLQCGRCSPPAWGWSGLRPLAIGINTVLPTRVGMVRWPRPCVVILCCAPHPRGDGPAMGGRGRRADTCSPPAWGWSGETEAETPHSPVLPTRVGMVRLPLGSVGECRGAPHPRGDGPIVPAAICLSISCSPPAWGWSVTEAPTPSSRFVLPTRVGMVRPSPHYTPG